MWLLGKIKLIFGLDLNVVRFLNRLLIIYLLLQFSVSAAYDGSWVSLKFFSMIKVVQVGNVSRSQATK